MELGSMIGPLKCSSPHSFPPLSLQAFVMGGRSSFSLALLVYINLFTYCSPINLVRYYNPTRNFKVQERFWTCAILLRCYWNVKSAEKQLYRADSSFRE